MAFTGKPMIGLKVDEAAKKPTSANKNPPVRKTPYNRETLARDNFPLKELPVPPPPPSSTSKKTTANNSSSKRSASLSSSSSNSSSSSSSTKKEEFSTIEGVTLKNSYSSENLVNLKNATDAHLHRIIGAPNNNDQEPWQNFDRYYTANLDIDEISTGRQYIFLVRPECNIVMEDWSDTLTKELQTDPFFTYMLKYHRVILKGLTAELTKDHDFIPFLVGRTEALQIPDYTIRSYNLVQPYTHYSLPYGGNGIESQSGGTFDITFRDDAQFRIHKFFQAWLYYIDGVSRNKFPPKPKFITYNKIDYATSVYQFIVSPEGSKILWWSKYTGCIPTSISNSDLSWNKGGTFDGKFSVPFTYFHHEALNPRIISDFNKNSSSTATTSKAYNNELLTMDGSYVGAPWVESQDGGYSMYLRWRKPITTYQ